MTPIDFPVQQLGLDLSQAGLARDVVCNQSVEGRRGVFQSVEHVQNIRFLHISEKCVPLR